MNYLFFDTESSNCFNNKYKMCELGSLITDESFHLLPGTKRDVLINPGKDGRFNLTGRKGGRDVKLAHLEEEYWKAPTFDVLYDNVKFMLGQQNTMIFLWAAENDIQAIIDQCRRYKKPKLSFVSYDVQMLFMAAFPEISKTPNLETAMDMLEISRVGITSHRPDDDSYMAMMVLQGLCKKTGKTVKQLIDACPRCRMESISAYNAMWDRHNKKQERKRLAQAFEEIFNRDTPEDAPLEKCFTVSNQFKRHSDQTLNRVTTWLDRGYFLKRSLNEVPYVVYFDEADKEFLTSKLDLSKLKLISIAEFDEMTQN